MAYKNVNSVTITDVTLREFGQNVPETHLHIFTPEIRGRIASDLIGAGFRNLEILSCIHPKVAPAMHESALRKISADLGRIDGVHMITLIPNLAGYRSFCSLGLGPDEYNHTMGIFFSAIEAHNLANLGRPLEETVEEYRAILKDASNRDIRVVGYISAAFGYMAPEKGTVIKADLGEITRYMELLFDLGVQTVTLSDLQGVADKGETKRIFESILETRKGRDINRIGYHPHHISGGQALTNSKAAFDLGIRRFDASLGGTGGCITGAPGNQPTEKLVPFFSKMGVDTGINENGVFSLSESVREELYRKIPLSRSLRRLSENEIFFPRSRKAKIITTGIH